MSELVVPGRVTGNRRLLVVVGVLALVVGSVLGMLVVLGPSVAALLAFVTLSSLIIFTDLRAAPVLIAFFLPFQNVFTLEIAGYTLKTSQVLVLLSLLAWSLRSFQKRDFRVAQTSMNFPLLLFLVAGLISVANAINVSRSVAILSWALFSFLFFLLMASLVRTEDLLRKVVVSLLVSGTLVSLFGLYQFAGSYLGLPTLLRDVYLPTGMYLTRVQSTFLEPLHFASFLLVTIPVCVALYLGRVRKFHTRYLLISLLVMGLALVLTIARGGYLGLVVSVFALFLFTKKTGQKRGRVIKIALSFAVVILVLVVAVIYLAPPGIISTTILGGEAIRAGSSFTRMLLMKDAWAMFLESPLIGVGIGNFGPYANQRVFRSTTIVADFGTANNVPLEVLAESGILGFLALVLVFLSYLRGVWQGMKSAKSHFLSSLLAGLAAGFLGLSFQYLTYSPFYGEWTWFLLGLSMAAVNLAQKESNPMQEVAGGGKI
jgi:O-antigen ligase